MAVEGVADSGGSVLLAPEEPRKRGRGRPLGRRDRRPRTIGTKPLGRPRKNAEVEKPSSLENHSVGELSTDLAAHNSHFAGIITLVLQLLQLLKNFYASNAENSLKSIGELDALANRIDFCSDFKTTSVCASRVSSGSEKMLL